MYILTLTFFLAEYLSLVVEIAEPIYHGTMAENGTCFDVGMVGRGIMYIFTLR
jgi:hypothetical protein